MRIVYGVFGYGRGHATRALAVLPELRSRHDLLIMAGGDAYDALVLHHPVVRLPTLRFVYGSHGKRSTWGTLRGNLDALCDLFGGGEGYQTAVRTMRDFRPEVAICDAEPWTHRAAAALRIPRISFDHFGILIHCRPPLAAIDRQRAAGDAWVYRQLMGKPERMIVSSFYSAPVRYPSVACVGPMLRDEICALRSTSGEHILVYLNNGRYQLTSRLEELLYRSHLPMRIYGTSRRGRDGDLEYCPPGDRSFLEDLAGCRAVLCTAGNQLVGEAMALGKPLLVKPEDSVEQRMNAAAVARLGIGLRTSDDEIDLPLLHRFLSQEKIFAETALSLACDGRREAVAFLQSFARELQMRGRFRRARDWRYA